MSQSDQLLVTTLTLIEPRREKTELQGFQPGLTYYTAWAVQPQKQARSLKFLFKKKRNCMIGVAKTKALISCAVTAQLICIFVFAYADCWLSHEAAQLSICGIVINFDCIEV